MPLTKIDDRGLTTPVDLQDNEKIRLGTGNDLNLYHNGVHSFVHTDTGNLSLSSVAKVQLSKADQGGTGNYEYMLQAFANGAVELYHDNSKKFETTSAGATLTGALTTTGNINVPTANAIVTGGVTTTGATALTAVDNGTAYFGTGNDLRILHNGTQSEINSVTGGLAIKDTGGFMRIRSDELKIQAATGNENYIECDANGAVQLFYDNTLKFGTDSAGVYARGNLMLNYADNYKIKLGAGNDLQIYHDGSHSYVSASGTGALKLLGNNNDDVQIQPRSGYNSLRCKPNGAVELYYDNSKKFETTSTGVSVTGSLNIPDSQVASFGNSEDFKIYHDGTNNYLRSNGLKNIYINPKDTDVGIKVIGDGGVELYHDNSKKFEATSYGTRTTGYHTQSTAIGFQGDNADWTSTTPHMHNLYLHWTSGHFVNSTGVFTCPVAGKYLCSASVQAHRSNNPSGSSGQYYNVIWQKNSSNYHTEMVGTLATDASSLSASDVNGKHETVTATVIIDCAANDTIRAHSNHGYRHNSQNICSVYLLG